MADKESEWGSPTEINDRVKQALASPMGLLIGKLKEAKRLLEAGGMTPDDKTKLIAELEAVIAAYDRAFNDLAARLEEDDVKELLAWTPGSTTSPPSGGGSSESEPSP